jgi:hypothetical protein
MMTDEGKRERGQLTKDESDSVIRGMIEEYGHSAVVDALRTLMHEGEPFDNLTFNLMEVHCITEYLEMGRER